MKKSTIVIIIILALALAVTIFSVYENENIRQVEAAIEDTLKSDQITDATIFKKLEETNNKLQELSFIERAKVDNKQMFFEHAAEIAKKTNEMLEEEIDKFSNINIENHKYYEEIKEFFDVASSCIKISSDLKNQYEEILPKYSALEESAISEINQLIEKISNVTVDHTFVDAVEESYEKSILLGEKAKKRINNIEVLNDAKKTIDKIKEDAYVPCEECEEKGYLYCGNCHGNGKKSCYSCGGDGRESCYWCKGSGSMKYYSGLYDAGEYGRCGSCGGRGSSSCSSCGGSGGSRCYECSGNGKFTCTQCNGEGGQYIYE